MCGIAAAVGPGDLAAAVEAMCEQMHARGPDGGGLVRIPRDGGAAVLGNRRLAIIDPSPAGRQPMSDPARGTTISFNGMIYNFRELRDRLAGEGELFSSECDTEVVLKAYGRYGADCVRHLRGMFAFALWDRRRGELLLARDRLGIKPLYYHDDGLRLVCASQVKALLASGLVPARLSPAGLRTYLRYGAVSEPLTAIDGVRALPAGHRATYRDGRLELERYWEPPEPVEEAWVPEAGAWELRELLAESIRRHLVSDAPLGVFLSGGVDSTALAALAAREGDVTTLTVVFDDPSLSEAAYARLVADRIGSHHIEVPLSAPELLSSLPEAFAAMDQPTFDGVNTYVISRAAHEAGLKVALSGLGADELFDGYGNGRRAVRLERVRALPGPAATAAGTMVGRVLGGSRGDKARAWLRGEIEPGASYELLRGLFGAREVSGLLRGAAGADGSERPDSIDVSGDVLGQVSALELTTYMRNVLLRDADAMGMACSLEVRVPYLDDPFVERALRLPGRIRCAPEKALLVAATRDLLPAQVAVRRKHGFLLPIGGWLKNGLRAEVEAALREPPEPLASLLQTEAVGRVWESHLRDGGRWLQPWALYALCRWVESIEAPAARVLVEAR